MVTSTQADTRYNFVYIIDVSDSMSGNPLQEAKNAYISLTNSLIDSGIADVSQFAIIPFGTEAFLNAPLSATDAISTIEGLSVNGFTNFNAALEKANQFFSTVPPGTINTAYFLSDGFSTTGGNFKNTAEALQGVADVQAYGFGAANIQDLAIVDSDKPTIVSEASELGAEFTKYILSRDDIKPGMEQGNDDQNPANIIPQTPETTATPEFDNIATVGTNVDELTDAELPVLNVADSIEDNNPVIENDGAGETSQIVPQNPEQNITDGNLLNLESLTGDTAMTFTVDREALFDNTVGFYKIEDAEGTITDPITGSKLKPSDGKTYAELAVKLHEPELALSVNNLSSTTIQDSLSGGYLYAPFIITNGNIDTLEGDLSRVYFSFAPANSDGVEHIRSLGNNTLGFEDSVGGGDNDFNDVVIRTQFTTV